jgi:hypothetical protein
METSALWVEEKDKAVWHRATGRVERTLYRAVCGWQLDVRQGRVWPQKRGQFGPPEDERCHTCVGSERPG